METPETAHKAYLALGSNMGDREGYLFAALRALRESGVEIPALSGIYETAPVGYKAQGMFLNMTCMISLSLNPFELLAVLRKIENSLRRERLIRWGPRTIDLDILLYDDAAINDPELSVPHPRMFERAFVLTPLRDIWLGNEIRGRSFAELIAACADKDEVFLYKSASEAGGLFQSRS
jgi:2-amino-4-hydroxy-6-hydroxymethyldihydropteridine diphosphokinase